MKIIKDIFRQKKIDLQAISLVKSVFTSQAINSINATNKKKSLIKLDQLINELSHVTLQYSQQQVLGFYGKARLLKGIQNTLYQLELDNDLISYMINKFVYL